MASTTGGNGAGVRPWLVLLGVAVSLVAPILAFGPPQTDSAWYNHLWTLEIAEELARGDPYPRWLSGSFEGLGSPTFYFYPPLAFLVSGGLDFVGLSTNAAIGVTALVFLAASGAGMFTWLRFRRAPHPLLGAGLYMAAPYHLFDLYQRGALAEFAALAWLPLIALGIEALPRRWAVPLLATATAGLLLTHLPMALLAGVFLIAPASVAAVWRNRGALLPGLFAGALGVGAAAFYLLPALTLQGHISEHLLWEPHFRPQVWFFWKPFPAELAFLPVLAVVLAICAVRRTAFWGLIAAGSAAAAVGVIPSIWDIPLLAKAQFPWRLLGVAEFAAITALAEASSRRRRAGAVALALFTALLAVLNFAPRFLVPPDTPALHASRFDAPEYLPRDFRPQGLDRTARKLDLSAYRDLPAGPAITVEQPARVVLRQTAFPIWRVTRDGQAVANRGPLITFDASPGVYRVERVMLWQEQVGALVSVLALMLLLVTTAWSFARRSAATDGGADARS
ncbi:hypothetical protein [Phenylobacterium sp.]|uniref:hypothetical protein n=1 Tax=Phenylobacterium sp. TaxID=1871053 RepID=UPI002ED858BC